MATLFLTILAGGVILAVKAQQLELPTAPQQPIAAQETQPAPVLPKLPADQGKVLAQKQYLEDGSPTLLALTLSTKNEVSPTVRLRKYALQTGQPVLPAKIVSLQQQTENITSNYTKFAGYNGEWRGDIAIVGKNVFVLLAGLSIYDMSLFVYRLNPNTQTKATSPVLREFSEQEKTEIKRRVAQYQKQHNEQSKTLLPPGFLDNPQWHPNPTDIDKPPLATLTKDFFRDGSQLLPREVRFDTVTPDAVTIRVIRELEDKTWSETWKKGPLLYRYDLKTGKWSVAQPTATELAERAAKVALEKRQSLMHDYRSEREKSGLSKADATARIRQRYDLKDWEPIPADWDTPDLVPKMYWLTPTPTPPPTVKGETVAPATK